MKRKYLKQFDQFFVSLGNYNFCFNDEIVFYKVSREINGAVAGFSASHRRF